LKLVHGEAVARLPVSKFDEHRVRDSNSWKLLGAQGMASIKTELQKLTTPQFDLPRFIAY
jgi:hypothetical protein